MGSVLDLNDLPSRFFFFEDVLISFLFVFLFVPLSVVASHHVCCRVCQRSCSLFIRLSRCLHSPVAGSPDCPWSSAVTWVLFDCQGLPSADPLSVSMKVEGGAIGSTYAIVSLFAALLNGLRLPPRYHHISSAVSTTCVLRTLRASSAWQPLTSMRYMVGW